MRKNIILLAALILIGCTIQKQNIQATSTIIDTTVRATATSPIVFPTPSPTITPSPTYIPSSTFTPTPTTKPLTEREQVIAQHELERIQYLSEQGPALSIPALEYHSDNYYTLYPNGAVVELSPPAFVDQMSWFHDHHVHSVTGEELIAWLKGEIELPARSVILTFDLGNKPLESIYRMVSVFKQYQMFAIFTIYSYGMDPSESVVCAPDNCWQAYIDAYASGYVTIGSHTITHRDFATLSASVGLNELLRSKKLIEEKIGQGLVVNILTWPYESVPPWGDKISTIGFEAAFGGNTYPILKNTAWLNKPEDFFKLPRIIPPGSGGISGRPNGKTIEEIMIMYTNGWK